MPILISDTIYLSSHDSYYYSTLVFVFLISPRLPAAHFFLLVAALVRLLQDVSSHFFNVIVMRLGLTRTEQF